MTGHLQRINNLFPPVVFYIMEIREGYHYYAGQLLREQGEWRAYSNYAQDKVEQIQEYLGMIVELWYE